jgi:hypothetical protein
MIDSQLFGSSIRRRRHLSSGRRTLSCTYYLSENYRFSFNVDGKDTFALAPSSVVLMGICDVVRRLLVANAMEVYELESRNVSRSSEVFYNAPNFAFLVEQCQSQKTLAHAMPRLRFLSG